MVKVAYSHRIVCDPAFATWLLTLDPSVRNTVLRKMMFIKSSSLHHAKEHIVMLRDEYATEAFQESLVQSLGDPKNFCGAVKIIETPPFLRSETDQVSKYVRYAVYLANEKPYRSIILTTNDREQSYQENEHFTSLRGSVTINDERDGVSAINSFFREFEPQRQYSERG